MKNSVRLLLAETQKKMSGYAVLLNFRLMNLCVKAEPVSLLSVTVSVNGQDNELEDVASISLENEYQFAVIPKSRLLLYAVGKSIKKAHPEFKLEEKSNNTDDPEEVTLYCSMPQVDDERYEECQNYVNLVFEECQTKLELTKVMYTAKIAKETLGSPDDEVEQIEEEFQQIYEQHINVCNSYKESKVKEIEEAYQKYLTGVKEQTDRDIEQGQGVDAGFQMKMETPV